MGITIFYQGKLKPTVDRELVIDIVTDIAQSLEWETEKFYDKKKNLKGVILNPYPDCESLNFIFTKDGLLVNILMYGWRSKHKIEPIIDNVVKLCFCKTQFSNPNTHIAIIRLLVFLKESYFEKLEIVDDGGYYPERNTEELVKKIDEINEGIDAISEALSTTRIRRSEFKHLNDQEIIDKIEDVIKNAIVKLKNKKNDSS